MFAISSHKVNSWKPDTAHASQLGHGCSGLFALPFLILPFSGLVARACIQDRGWFSTKSHRVFIELWIYVVTSLASPLGSVGIGLYWLRLHGLLHHLGNFVLVHEEILGRHNLVRLESCWIFMWCLYERQIAWNDTLYYVLHHCLHDSVVESWIDKGRLVGKERERDTLLCHKVSLRRV